MNINFSYYDIYSKQIGFFFNKKDRIGTNFGLVLTIIYIIVSLLLLIIYSVYTIKRINMKVYDSTTYPQDVPTLNISPKTLYFAFGLEDPNTSNRFIDQSIYYPKILFIDRVKVNGEFITTKKLELDYEPCNEEKFGEEYKRMISSGDLSNSYCLKDYNVTLSGGYKFNKFSYLRIRIYPCKNSTDNNFHCKPQDTIDYYLKGGYFSMITKDIGLNPNNISDPVVYTLQNLYTTIDKSITRDFLIYVGITEVQTDTGLLSTDIKSEFYLQFRQYHDPFFFRDIEEYHSGKDIFTAQIRLEEYIKIHKRAYTKISEIFSLIGGYMQLLYTIFSLITTLTKNINIEKKLLNSIFNFNIKKRKIILSIQYEKRLNYLIHSDKGNLNSFISYIAKKTLKPYKKKISPKQNKLSSIHKKEDTLYISENNSFIPLIKKSISGSVHFKNDTKNKIKNYSDKGVSQFHKLSKYKNTNFNDEQNANRSKINMLFKSNEEINSHFKNNLKKMKKNNRKITDDSEKKENEIDDESISDIKFNIFDFFCNFGKIENKRADIELFYSGVTFYRNLMNIIHFFNIIFMTEIMLNHKSCKKLSYFNQTLEIPVRAEKGQ